MPAVMPAFVVGHLQFGVVLTAGQQRLVDLCEFGVGAQGRDDGVGHRDRAHVAGFGSPDRHLGGAHDVGAGPIVGPRCGMQAVADRHRHQLVVGGVVLDLVDAVTVSVVGAQDRLVAVGELTPALRLLRARDRAEIGDLVDAPLAALADQRLGEHRGCGRVVVLQRRNLIGDDVRICHATDITLFRQPNNRRNIRVPQR